MEVFEQISLFDLIPTYEPANVVSCIPASNAVATNYMDGDRKDAQPVENWMAELIPDGVYYIMLGGHPVVLHPVAYTCKKPPEGHEYFYYWVNEQLYDSIGVGEL